MGSQPVPRSDVEIYTLRNSLRSNSLRRSGSGSFGGEEDENSRVMRDNLEDMERSGSLRLSATIEREETRRRLSREYGSGGYDDVDVEDEENEEEDGEEGAGGDDEEDGGDDGDGGGGGGGMVMSLMDLLEETDRQAGIEGPNYRFHHEEEDEEEVAEVEVASRGLFFGDVSGGDYSCCVCMVKLKGAETLTCGHVFCKMCTKDLWVQKGHCPVCNNYILEILDMF